MAAKKRSRQIHAFDLGRSMMFRMSANITALDVCQLMKEILQQSKAALLSARVDMDEFEVLRRAYQNTEKAYGGVAVYDLFDAYYELGKILLRIGKEDLGISCHYLHHTYNNRSVMHWPTSKVWRQGEGFALKALLPIFADGFPDFEADTARDGVCLA
ncbi:MAG: hypothetical protein ACOYUZ_00605 [Patescibacteria group bacterium]